MNYKEALKEIEKQIAEYELLDIAAEALEKQIPKNLTISMMDTLEERTGEDVGILHRQNSQSKESS